MMQPDGPRLWQRVCAACGMFDGAWAVIAREADAAGRLAADPSACPSCGGHAAFSTRRMEDEDLELLTIRQKRGDRDP